MTELNQRSHIMFGDVAIMTWRHLRHKTIMGVAYWSSAVLLL